MTDILLTNDDGYDSVGFYSLLKNLSGYFSVKAIAPATKQSWTSKSTSRFKTVSRAKVKLNEFEISSLSGTPADCVQVGLYNILKEKPKLVVSGINMGLNTGRGFILSSGTIGASMEAAINGVKSIAVSFYIPEELRKIKASNLDQAIFHNAAVITTNIIKKLIDKPFKEDIDLITINIPFAVAPDAEIEITRPHRVPYGKLFHETEAGYKHIPPPFDFSVAEPGTDLEAVARGKVSITPISLELVSDKSIQEMKELLNEK